jgi:hypothetical protein
MGGMEKVGKNSPKSNFHMGGALSAPPTSSGNSKPPSFLGLRYKHKAKILTKIN